MISAFPDGQPCFNFLIVFSVNLKNNLLKSSVLTILTYSRKKSVSINIKILEHQQQQQQQKGKKKIKKHIFDTQQQNVTVRFSHQYVI